MGGFRGKSKSRGPVSGGFAPRGGIFRGGRDDWALVIGIMALILSMAGLGFATGQLGDSSTALCPAGQHAQNVTEASGSVTLVCSLHDAYNLGTWYNMPSAVTELFGNQSNERFLAQPAWNGLSGFSLMLEVSCINPSNTLGAFLQLQYANVSDFFPGGASFGYFFVGPWTNTGGQALIDQSAAQCSSTNNSPQILATVGSVPKQPNADFGWLLRVVGGGGGGTGDNPSFSDIQVIVGQTRNFVQTSATRLKTTTSFQAQITTAFPTFQPITTTFDWQAFNSTVGTNLSKSGSSSCTILAGGFQCFVNISFGITFPAVPRIFIEITSTPVNFSAYESPIIIFSTPTVTV